MFGRVGNVSPMASLVEKLTTALFLSLFFWNLIFFLFLLFLLACFPESIRTGPGYICSSSNPTDPFTMFELQNPLHEVLELQKISSSPDLEALKWRKGWSGIASWSWLACILVG